MADSNKYNTSHMSYYYVNIVIRGFKEATYGTTPGMLLVNPMHSMLNSRRPGAHIQPWSLTQPYMVWGVSSRKVWNFSAAKAMDQHMVHTAVSPAKSQWYMFSSKHLFHPGSPGYPRPFNNKPTQVCWQGHLVPQ